MNVDPREKLRGELEALKDKSEEAYDKLCVTLSSGAFAFTVLFAEKLTGGNPTATGWLYAGWTAFALSLGMSLGSHFTAARCMAQHIRTLDAGQWPTRGSFLHRVTIVCNVSAGVLLLAGISCVAAFVGANL